MIFGKEKKDDAELTKLRPCPHCGSDAAVKKVIVKIDTVSRTVRYFIKCSECSLQTVHPEDSIGSARLKWNARVDLGFYRCYFIPFEPEFDGIPAQIDDEGLVKGNGQ